MRLMSLADLRVTGHSLAAVAVGEDRTRRLFLAAYGAFVAKGLRPRLVGYR
ncbi:hypothetical protein FQZ97_755860 [compost metagenome]